MFNTKPKSKADCDWQKVDEYAKVLDALCVESERRLRDENPDLLVKFQSELKRQKAGFSYSFVRHGDFMTISLTRNGNLEPEWGERKVKHAETINLGRLKSIKLCDGYAPDEQASFGWCLQTVGYDKDGKAVSWGSSSGLPMGPPSGRYKHEVFPHGSPTFIPLQRPFVEWDEKERDAFTGLSMSMNEGPRYYTKNFPRQSRDDVVTFNGLGLKLFAPYGRGKNVMDALLSAIEAPA